MKKFLTLIILAVTCLCTSFTANAQFRFGVKAGMAVNSLHFNSELLDSENRAGFTGGVMMEFTVPVVGIGVDLSAMYVRRNSEWGIPMDGSSTKYIHNDRNYFDIPLNLKWKMNIPVINNIVRPYLFTGPTFSFLTGKKNIENAFRNRGFDTSWNFGAGLELFKHLQVGASYSLGMTKALNRFDITNTADIEGHNRYWTVTAAYLF